MMKGNNVTRILSCLLAAVMVFALAACGRTEETRGTPPEERQESSELVTEPAESTDNKSDDTTDIASEGDGTAQGGSKSLIAYFTAAENSGVDAVSSASYTTIGGTAVGRLRAVADMIQENTDGDLFSIRTSVVYPADGGELIDYASQEQGENARPELTSRIEDLDQSLKRNGIYDRVKGLLEKAGKDVVDFPGIMPNPTYAKVQEGAALAREKGVDFILAVGGGSVIDCCKIIAAQAKTDEDIWEMEFTKGKYPTEYLPMGAVVTASGTGAEQNCGAVITNEEKGVKTGVVVHPLRCSILH